MSLGEIELHDEDFIEVSLANSPRTLRSPCIAGWRPMCGGQPRRFASPPYLSFLPLSGTFEQAALPILFGRAEPPREDGTLGLHYDLWGTIFWYLARVEELETDERDKFGVYNARQSFTYHTGILRRAVVDEHVDYLSQLIEMLWPGVGRPRRLADTLVTCDVDVPCSHSLEGWAAAVRTLGADLLLRRSINLGVQTLRNLWRVKTSGDYSLDPFNSFSWYINQCDVAGRRAAFYFISGNSAPEIDSRYELTHPVIRQALTIIAERGHEIGMHASYTAFQNSALTKWELANLKHTCQELGIDQQPHGNRQHYLRWDWRTTPDILADAGFAYDTTLGYNDAPGFRCGTCYEFPLWSWKTGQQLAIRERPLIAMAGSLTGEHGLKLTHGEARALLRDLKDTCRRHGGTFVCLWHNNELRLPADRMTFMQAIS